MTDLRNVMITVASVAAFCAGSLAADIPSPAPPRTAGGYGVVEDIHPDDTMAGGMAAPVPAGSPATQESVQARPAAPRFVVRVRLDDGRYLGFHQAGGDELRVGDRVQIENDRLRRAQEPGITVK